MRKKFGKTVNFLKKKRQEELNFFGKILTKFIIFSNKNLTRSLNFKFKDLINFISFLKDQNKTVITFISLHFAVNFLVKGAKSKRTCVNFSKTHSTQNINFTVQALNSSTNSPLILKRSQNSAKRKAR
ncbi:hypothetical protein [Campylobacter troglodytis]|uniref:hypothetical protein n=1 Tax=Campylobacter troglodytis TaxID=654363 RepID=UPI0011589956|nr:hypothetical protein [Campylobacter troglodytis]TQR56927.1 hypothetical protein DMC01_08865 [Campylobacter troglodytis]